MKRILAKKSIINQLSFPLTINKYDNTFFILCIDDVNTIQFFNNIVMLKHSSFLKFIKCFNFSDSYVCFFNIQRFIDLLRISLLHFKQNTNDGVNMLFGFIYNGLFINIFNINLIENILNKHNYFLYFENFFSQLIFIIIKFIEIFIFSNIDNFFLSIENHMLNF